MNGNNGELTPTTNNANSVPARDRNHDKDRKDKKTKRFDDKKGCVNAMSTHLRLDWQFDFLVYRYDWLHNFGLHQSDRPPWRRLSPELRCHCIRDAGRRGTENGQLCLPQDCPSSYPIIDPEIDSLLVRNQLSVWILRVPAEPERPES